VTILQWKFGWNHFRNVGEVALCIFCQKTWFLKKTHFFVSSAHPLLTKNWKYTTKMINNFNKIQKTFLFLLWSKTFHWRVKNYMQFNWNIKYMNKPYTPKWFTSFIKYCNINPSYILKLRKWYKHLTLHLLYLLWVQL
jgi:hypothetical protein